MDNYAGYKLKDEAELAGLLAGCRRIAVVSCGKCFRLFSEAEVPCRADFLKLAEAAGVEIAVELNPDFLCNKSRTAQLIETLSTDGIDAVFSVSCGLGVQTLAGMLKLPVYAACDSVKAVGEHGMAISEIACDACAQCFLNITGGICPIVDCAKSLVNGQCGGAKNGKCEVDSSKDCAWEKINKKLEALGRLEEFRHQPVQLRDYSKTNFEKINGLVKASREKHFEGFIGGVHPTEKKDLTDFMAAERFPEPEILVIPLSQHSGAPAVCTVKVGDYVKVGQLIGKAEGKVSSNVHSGVSGTVKAIEMRPHPAKGQVLSVVIRSDGKNIPDEALKPGKSLDDMTPAEILETIGNAGVVGLGGAAFPTDIKLRTDKPINNVLLNGCECEPLITADHRVMLEYADDVILGLRAMMKAVGAKKGIIVIEENKPDAIALLTEKTSAADDIEVFPVKTKYPQGAKQMILKRVLGLKSTGGRSSDLGAIVGNVSSAKAIADAIKSGAPLTERIVTVSGDMIERPGNYLVKFGTSIRDIIEYCGGLKPGKVIVKMGGPMMGTVLKDLDVPVVKNTNGIMAIEDVKRADTECIRCGRCADVCPMELSPLSFAALADRQDWNGMKELNLKSCIDCGCCEYICSAGIPIVSKIKAGKKAVAEMK